MKLIKRIFQYLGISKKETPKSREEVLQKARKLFCNYTENPFSTDVRNYIQPIKGNSPYGAGKILKTEEIKKFIDNGICFIDYPVLDDDGKEIPGLTRKDYNL